MISTLFLALLLSACGSDPNTGNTPTSQSTGTASTSSASPTETSQEVKSIQSELKKTEKIGTIEITVNKIQNVTSKNNAKPASKNVFVIINITIKNTGETKINLNRFLNFSLVDTRGNKGQALVAIDWVAQDYAAGQEKTGEAGFEIKDDPDRTVDYTFTFSFQKSQVSWSFKLAN
jgi:membrane-bound lytic murein transglycosylase